VVIVNGQATGVWKRMIKNDKVMIETDFFHPHRQAETTLVELAAQNYARFLGKGASVIHTS